MSSSLSAGSSPQSSPRNDPSSNHSINQTNKQPTDQSISFAPDFQSLSYAAILDRNLALLQYSSHVLAPSIAQSNNHSINQSNWTKPSASFNSPLANHKAFQSIAHFLLTTLYSLQSINQSNSQSIVHLLSGCPEFQSINQSMKHCYPCFDANQSREFIDVVCKILTYMQSINQSTNQTNTNQPIHPSKNMFIFTPNSIRKSYLQQPQGPKIITILSQLSTFTVRVQLESIKLSNTSTINQSDLIPSLSANQSINQSNEITIPMLRSHIALAGKQVLAAYDRRLCERSLYESAANDSRAYHNAITEQINISKSYTAELSANVDPIIYSEQRTKDRRAELSFIQAIEDRIAEFLAQYRSEFAVIERANNDKWMPSTFRAEQLGHSNNHTVDPSNQDLSVVLDEWCDSWVAALDSIGQQSDNDISQPISKSITVAQKLQNQSKDLHDRLADLQTVFQTKQHHSLQTSSQPNTQSNNSLINSTTDLILSPATPVTFRAMPLASDVSDFTLESCDELSLEDFSYFDQTIKHSASPYLDQTTDQSTQYLSEQGLHDDFTQVSYQRSSISPALPALSAELTSEMGLLDEVDDVTDEW